MVKNMCANVLLDNFLQTPFNKTRSYINIAYLLSLVFFLCNSSLANFSPPAIMFMGNRFSGDPLQDQTFIRYMQYVIAINKLTVSSK